MQRPSRNLLDYRIVSTYQYHWLYPMRHRFWWSGVAAALQVARNAEHVSDGPGCSQSGHSLHWRSAPDHNKENITNKSPSTAGISRPYGSPVVSPTSYPYIVLADPPCRWLANDGIPAVTSYQSMHACHLLVCRRPCPWLAAYAVVIAIYSNGVQHVFTQISPVRKFAVW